MNESERKAVAKRALDWLRSDGFADFNIWTFAEDVLDQGNKDHFFVPQVIAVDTGWDFCAYPSVPVFREEDGCWWSQEAVKLGSHSKARGSYRVFNVLRERIVACRKDLDLKSNPPLCPDKAIIYRSRGEGYMTLLRRALGPKDASEWWKFPGLSELRLSTA